MESKVSTKNWWIMSLLMTPPIGPLGAYIYYTKGSKAGFLRTITLNGVFILYFVDCFKVLSGKMTDGEGKKIQLFKNKN